MDVEYHRALTSGHSDQMMVGYWIKVSQSVMNLLHHFTVRGIHCERTGRTWVCVQTVMEIQPSCWDTQCFARLMQSLFCVYLDLCSCWHHPIAFTSTLDKGELHCSVRQGFQTSTYFIIALIFGKTCNSASLENDIEVGWSQNIQSNQNNNFDNYQKD